MGCGSCATGGCGNCGSKTNGSPAGCRNNGTCATKGCNKFNVFDWLGNMKLPSEQLFDIVEVRFKGGRKEFYRLPPRIDAVTGDAILVQAENGYHLGHISLQGELVRLQMSKMKVKDNDDILPVLRVASPKDLEKAQEVENRELPTLYRTREIVREMNLEMKLSDVEYQADNTKATFYYSAEQRVDFRQLIRILAAEFRVRIEMRQISLRQEAGRLGGIGSCGRELCCSTWLHDFKSVSTSAARYQNLSLNPSKLSGQCGRLKCCLNYELETYMEALKDIPLLEKPLLTEKGDAYLQKTDIFRRIMWFSYQEESTWYALEVEKVIEIIELNEKNIIVASLEDTQQKVDIETGFKNNLSLEDSESVLQKSKKKSRKRNRKRSKRPNDPAEEAD